MDKHELAILLRRHTNAIRFNTFLAILLDTLLPNQVPAGSGHPPLPPLGTPAAGSRQPAAGSTLSAPRGFLLAASDSESEDLWQSTAVARWSHVVIRPEFSVKSRAV
jgi:hypothetical protein